MSIRYKEGEEGRKEGRKAERVVQTQNQHTCCSCCGPALMTCLLKCTTSYLFLLEHAGSCYKLDGEEDHSKSLHMKIWTHCSHSLSVDQLCVCLCVYYRSVAAQNPLTIMQQLLPVDGLVLKPCTLNVHSFIPGCTNL